MTRQQSKFGALLILAGIIIFMDGYLNSRPWDLQTGPLVELPFGCDFINFWMGGRLSRLHQTFLLADPQAYDAAIAAYFGHHPGDLVFSYPPHSLLVLAPLSLLPYSAALCAWTALNIGALAWATARLAEAGNRRALLICACLSPAALTMVLYGQFGGLLALGALVVVLDSEERPIVAGLCLALMTVKPQIALALGLIMLLSGRWRCLVVAAGVTAVMILLSVAVFGLKPWLQFVQFTLPAQNQILIDGRFTMVRSTISVFRAGQLLHLPIWAAWGAQIVASVFAIGLPVLAFRRGRGRLTLAFVTPLGVLLAQPYVNGYDLAMVAPALTMLLLTSGDNARPAYASMGVWFAPPLAAFLNTFSLPLAPLVMAYALFRQGSWRGLAIRSADAGGEVLVEPRGVEPLTSSLRTRRSTN